jgi:hypothetical protein
MIQTNTVTASAPWWFGAVMGMGWLGFLGTAIGWLRERGKHHQEVRNYLGEMRRRLAQRPELLAIVALLRREQEAASSGAPAPVPEWDGVKLRELPAFLEVIGIQLAFDSNAPQSAYDEFAEEVLLCYRSALMWQGDGCNDTYWRDFKRFARATEERVAHADIRPLGPCTKRVGRQDNAAAFLTADQRPHGSTP